MNRVDERRYARSQVVLIAVIEFGKKRIAVRVSNVSAYGALILGAKLPPAGARIAFQCDDVRVDGRVAWSEDGRAGIHFAEAVNPQRLRAAMRRVTHSVGEKQPVR